MEALTKWIVSAQMGPNTEYRQVTKCYNFQQKFSPQHIQHISRQLDSIKAPIIASDHLNRPFSFAKYKIIDNNIRNEMKINTRRYLRHMWNWKHNSPFHGCHLFSLISVWNNWEGGISAPGSWIHVYVEPDMSQNDQPWRRLVHKRIPYFSSCILNPCITHIYIPSTLFACSNYQTRPSPSTGRDKYSIKKC